MGRAEVIGSKAEQEQNRYIFLGRYYADDFESDKSGDFVFIQRLEVKGVNGEIKGSTPFNEYWSNCKNKEQVKQVINNSVAEFIKANSLKLMLDNYNVAERLGEI
ncbi:hypothetical protein [Domibacillus epiphyticus]|uniref:Uncharacterized protein n=1 Tax=Domibacillus epiphyticus TaxID=1714355 RepID=A0A1V2ABT1_9BACI|nr:hypothetical protein [Domibacillus epiphyticus]OMP68451.1 hypothetical protein BTO28_02185 [Domibacillus epiphyticus]